MFFNPCRVPAKRGEVLPSTSTKARKSKSRRADEADDLTPEGEFQDQLRQRNTNGSKVRSTYTKLTQ